MDYKRKYEQAMFRMNKWVEGSEITDPKEVAEFVFPELRESEDERIRKNLREFLLDAPSQDIVSHHLDLDETLNWLFKPAWSEEDEENVNTLSKIICDSQASAKIANKLSGWLKSFKERMKGHVTPIKCTKTISVFDLTWEDINTLEDLMAHVHYEFRNGISAEDFGKEVLEQFLLNKDIPEESEVESELPNGEDYGIDSLYHAARILEKTLGDVEGYQSDDGILEHKCAIEAVNRLYKQKPWSEEDEEMYIQICNDIDYLSRFTDRCDINLFHKKTNWLKSLKERYTWKPSDEQIEALLKLEEMHVLEHEKNQENAHLYMVIKSLKEQLWKLKEE